MSEKLRRKRAVLLQQLERARDRREKALSAWGVAKENAHLDLLERIKALDAANGKCDALGRQVAELDKRIADLQQRVPAHPDRRVSRS